MAKTSEKKLSGNGKSLKSAGAARRSQKKLPSLVVKAAVKPAKQVPAKAVERPVAKSSAKAAATRFADKRKPAQPEKGTPDRVMKGINGSRRLVPAPTPAPAPAPVAAATVPPAPVRPSPPRAAETSGDNKTKKTHSGFTSRELEHFRDLLLAKRRELIGDMSAMEREALRTSGASNLSNLPIHMADMGTDNYEQEFTLGLVQKDRDLLKEINLALAKMQNGSYGLCEGTGQPINKERLEYQPWARYSVEHQRKMERHGR